MTALMISKSTEHLYLASHLLMSLENPPYLAASANLVDFGSSDVLRYCKMPSSLGLLYLKTETMKLIESCQDNRELTVRWRPRR